MKDTNRPGLWTIGFGEIGATLKALENWGVTVNHLARLRAEPAYAQRVAEFIIRGGLAGEINYKLARIIPGDNFFGPEDWLADYGFSLSQEEFNRITDFPWTEDVLNSPCPFFKGKKIKETHFAFLGMEKANGKPLTIRRWMTMHSTVHLPRLYLPRFYANWRAYTEGKGNEDFADKETCKLRWYLMPLQLIPDSLNKEYKQQLEIVPSNYEVATAIEEVTKNILYQRKTGMFVNASSKPSSDNRTKSVFRARGAGGSHISIGWFIATNFNDEKRLEISRYWDNDARPTLGLALSMKP